MRRTLTTLRATAALALAAALIGGNTIAADSAEAACRPTYAAGWGVYHPEWRVVATERAPSRNGGSWTNYEFQENKYVAANKTGGIKRVTRVVYNAPC